MRRAHTVEQVRAAEALLPEGMLMQRAATGLAIAISNFLAGRDGRTRTYGARVVLLVGSGANGGDALYAGANLARRGAAVTAVLLSDKYHRAGLAALLTAGGRVTSTPDVPREIAGAAVVVDGIVGIGGRPGLRAEALAAVRVAEENQVPIVAVDMPSGVDVDTGETPAEHVKATLTVTFGTHKICHLIDPAATACGPVHLVDIGLDLQAAPIEALQPDDVRRIYPAPRGESDKYSRGVLGLMVGSLQYPGAAVLAVGGALGGGLGIIRYVGPRSVGELVLGTYPEVVAEEGRVQGWVIGSGHGDEGDQAKIEGLLAGDLPVVVDADGLRYLPDRFTKPALLTPHAGELSRMLGVPRPEIEAQRLRYATVAADRFNATVLLKGSTTVIAAPDGRVRVNTNATPWLATAGSGDVLAGLCGSLLVAGLDPLEVGSVGAFLHAAAGRLASAGGPLASGQIAEKLPEATRQILV